MKALLAILGVLALATPVLASEGDGTLPFGIGLSGEASDKSVNMTIEQPRSFNGGESLRGPDCSRGYKRIKATGSGRYGNQTFRITAYCHRAGSSQYQVLAYSGTTNLTFGGTVSERGGNTIFAGTLTVRGAGGQSNSRFKVSD